MKTLQEILENLNNKERNIALSLISFKQKKDLSYLLAHLDQKISANNLKLLEKNLIKIRKGYPLAYVIGQKYFYGRPFLVSPAVLIPRPESELIIDLSIDYLKKAKNKTLALDIGTGSGALIISLAKELKLKNKDIYKNTDFKASDISFSALKIARLNQKKFRLAKKILFKQTNLLEAFLEEIKKDLKKNILIMANLPYLTPQERKEEPSIQAEPSLALIGGKDGLKLYYELLKKIKKDLKERNYYLIMEINPKQSTVLSAIVKKTFPLAKIEKKLDLSGQIRFLVVSSKLN